MKYETLYKRTSTGAVQIWYMEQEGNKHRATSGQQDGKHVTSDWTVCEGKNLGKANETSPEEQARLEIEAKYKKQRAQGKYHDTPDEIDNAKFFAPMLAQKYEDRPPTQEDFDAGVIVSQPKLDGMRCIANRHGLWTRKGKPIPVAPHIREALQTIFEGHRVTIDGELYNHNLKHMFEELLSIAKQSKPTEEDIAKAREWLQFHVYDMHDEDDPNATFNARYGNLVHLISTKSNTTIVRPVSTIRCFSQEELDALNESYVQDGYEGQMVRRDDTPYENKRAKQLLKRKEFVTEEFGIKRIEAGKGNRSTWAARIVCVTKEGKEFGSGINGNEAYCRKLLQEKDKYEDNGSEATIKFFRYTADGIPLFGKAVAIFEGKRDV